MSLMQEDEDSVIRSCLNNNSASFVNRQLVNSDIVRAKRIYCEIASCNSKMATTVAGSSGSMSNSGNSVSDSELRISSGSSVPVNGLVGSCGPKQEKKTPNSKTFQTTSGAPLLGITKQSPVLSGLLIENVRSLRDDLCSAECTVSDVTGSLLSTPNHHLLCAGSARSVSNSQTVSSSESPLCDNTACVTSPSLAASCTIIATWEADDVSTEESYVEPPLEINSILREAVSGNHQQNSAKVVRSSESILNNDNQQNTISGGIKSEFVKCSGNVTHATQPAMSNHVPVDPGVIPKAQGDKCKSTGKCSFQETATHQSSVVLMNDSPVSFSSSCPASSCTIIAMWSDNGDQPSQLCSPSTGDMGKSITVAGTSSVSSCPMSDLVQTQKQVDSSGSPSVTSGSSGRISLTTAADVSPCSVSGGCSSVRTLFASKATEPVCVAKAHVPVSAEHGRLTGAGKMVPGGCSPTATSGHLKLLQQMTNCQQSCSQQPVVAVKVEKPDSSYDAALSTSCHSAVVPLPSPLTSSCSIVDSNHSRQSAKATWIPPYQQGVTVPAPPAKRKRTAKSQTAEQPVTSQQIITGMFTWPLAVNSASQNGSAAASPSAPAVPQKKRQPSSSKRARSSSSSSGTVSSVAPSQLAVVGQPTSTLPTFAVPGVVQQTRPVSAATTESGFRRTVVRLTTQAPRSLLTRKFMTLAGRPIRERYIAPREMPPELHLPPSRRYLCPGCGDEFVTNVGMVDHLSRRTVVMSFFCLCKSGKWPRVFYNPCTLASFYQAHIRGPGLHCPADSYSVSLLTEETPEYQKCRADWESKKGPVAEKKQLTQGSKLATGSLSTNKSRKRSRVASNLSVGNGGGNAAKSASRSPKSAEPVDGKCQQQTAVGSTLCPPSKDTGANSESQQMSPGTLSTDGQTQETLQQDVTNFFQSLDRYGTTCQECSTQLDSRRALASHFEQIRDSVGDKLYCAVCKVNLPNRCAYEAHTRIHKCVQPYVCSGCGIHFDQIASFDAFMRHTEQACLHLVRSSHPFNKCVRCKLVLPEAGEQQMARHMIEVHAITYHKCSQCPMAFTNADAAARHSEEKTHDPEPRIVQKCPMCDAVFAGSNTDKMRSHVIGHFNLTMFRCAICPALIGRRNLMIDHMHNAHKIDILSANMCEVCGSLESSQLLLYKHIRSSHQTFFETVRSLSPLLAPAVNTSPSLTASVSSHSVKDVSVMSRKCGTRTTASMKRAAASEGKSNVDSGKYECARCEMEFPTQELYSRHEAKHRFMEGRQASKKKRLKVDTSKASFKQVQVTEPSSHSCSKCHERFLSASDLDQHCNVMHAVPTWHTCHLCADAFHSAEDLQQHMNAQHAAKTQPTAYVCQLCAESSTGTPRSFVCQSVLTKHLHQVHKVKRNTAKKQARAMALAVSTAVQSSQAEQEDGKSATSDVVPAKRLFVTGQTTHYQCVHCEFSADARDLFVAHVSEHSPTVQGSVQCKECGLYFPVAVSLYRHLFVVHRITCNVNVYLAENGGHPATELEDHPVPVSRSSTPSPAIQTVKSSTSLRSVSPSTPQSRKSKSSHSEGADDDAACHECTVCYRSFGSIQQLRVHMRVHGVAFIQGTRRKLGTVIGDVR